MLYNPYIEISAFFFLFITAIFFFFNRRFYEAKGNIFGIYIIVVLVNIFSNVVSAFTISYPYYTTLAFNYFINISYVSTHILSIILFIFFVLVITNSSLIKRKFVLSAILTPTFLYLILVITTSRHGLIFTFIKSNEIDNAYTYTHGALFFLLYIIALIYMILGVFITLRHKNHISLSQKRILLIYITLLAATMCIQIIFPYHMITGAMLALSLNSMYLTFQNPRYYTDNLTGFLVREVFDIEFESFCRKEKKDYNVILINLLNYKALSGLIGKKGCETIILTISSFLLSVFKNKNMIFRLADDRFAVFVHYKKMDKQLDTLFNRFSSTFKYNQSDIIVTASICSIPISCIIQPALHLEDNALNYRYIADSVFDLAAEKSRNENSVYIADTSIIESINRRRLIENHLGYNGEGGLEHFLKIYFQPIYNMKTGLFDTAEALLRMYSPLIGSIPPDEFIPVAEKSGLIERVGQFVINETYSVIERRNIVKLGVKDIHINLSMLEILQPDLPKNIISIRDKYAGVGTDVSFEITETAAITETNAILHVMEEIIKSGGSFILDDYGKGYSNNEALIKLPFTTVKLDRTLIKESVCGRKPIMLTHTINMLNDMGYNIVLEGIETKCEYDRIANTGIDYVQGYYFSHPIPEDEYVAFLEKNNIK